MTQGVSYIVEKVPRTRKGDSKGDAEQYVAKFESRKWISIALVLSAILSSTQDYFGDKTAFSKTITALHRVVGLYFDLIRTDHTALSVDALESHTIPSALKSLMSLFQYRQVLRGTQKVFKGIKIHSILHVPYLIRRFGAVSNWDTDHFESSHKDTVKDIFRRSSKQIATLEKDMTAKVRYFRNTNKQASKPFNVFSTYAVCPGVTNQGPAPRHSTHKR